MHPSSDTARPHPSPPHGDRRPIEPIDTRGLTPAAPASGTPIFETVDPRTLFVDPAYQRNLGERSIRQIRRIIEAFDWTRFKPPVCAFSEDETGASILTVIDGQHTAIAAASNPHVGMIPVMIVEAPDVQSQASAFIGQNTERLAMTATQMHVASITAGDEEAIALASLCDRAGVTIRKGPPSGGVGYMPGDTLSVAAISALIRKEGEVHAEEVLSILARAALAPIKADHIKAVDLLLSDAQFGAIDVDALPAHIEGMGEAAAKEARTFSATHGVPIWRAMASVWFQKAKKRKGGAEPKGTAIVAAPDSLVDDKRDGRDGWAPGNHVRRCEKCDQRFRGGRLATTCADCAYEERKEP